MSSTLKLGFGFSTAQFSTRLAITLCMLLALAGCKPANAQSTRPCDIFAAASPTTPCVAAFSTTRALYASYSGPLYQITRQSDSTTINIGLLSDGYANAATQDAYCAGTTCTITEIYDQSPNQSNLAVAPPGGATGGAGPNGYDLPASATALPITAGGHKVYGIFVPPGVGYRNNNPTNTARNGQPEGVYMVTTGLNVHGSNQCCFDFGNAETSNATPGPATWTRSTSCASTVHALPRWDWTWKTGSLARSSAAPEVCL